MTKPTAQVMPTGSANEPIVVRTDADGVSMLTRETGGLRTVLSGARPVASHQFEHRRV